MKLTGDKELIAALQRIQSDSNKVISRTLNNLAFEITSQIKNDVPRWVKTTRPFLPQSVIYDKATDSNLTALVGFHERVKFASLLEEGGTRQATGRAIAVPGRDLKRNAKGGVSAANRPRQALQRKGVWSGSAGGLGGIWQATARIPLRLLYVYKQSTRYNNKFFKFKATADTVIDRKGSELFKKNLNRLFER